MLYFSDFKQQKTYHCSRETFTIFRNMGHMIGGIIIVNIIIIGLVFLEFKIKILLVIHLILIKNIVFFVICG